MHAVDYAAIHTVLKVDVSDISLRSEGTIVSSVWHTQMIITMLYNAQLCTMLWQLCTMLWLAHAMIITSYCYHPTAGIETTWPSDGCTRLSQIPINLVSFCNQSHFPQLFPFFPNLTWNRILFLEKTTRGGCSWGESWRNRCVWSILPPPPSSPFYPKSFGKSF